MEEEFSAEAKLITGEERYIELSPPVSVEPPQPVKSATNFDERLTKVEQQLESLK